MDLNLFWYGQEALTSPDIYLPPDTPVRGTHHTYKLVQQRNRRITERAIRCHAHELQQSHSSTAQHFDHESLHSPKEKTPLLEFTRGDKFLRENQHKIDKLLQDTETMMSSEYEPMDMSADDRQVSNPKDEDYKYRAQFRKEAEEMYNQCIEWLIDSQQDRWEGLRRYMSDEAANIMNEIVEHQKSLAPPIPTTTHNEPIQHDTKRKRKKNKHKRDDQQDHNTQQQQQSTTCSVQTPRSTQRRPSSSSSNIPSQVVASSSSSSVSSKAPRVISTSSSSSTARSNQVPSVASTSSIARSNQVPSVASTSSSTSRIPEVSSASSWNPSFYRPSLVNNGKIIIKRMPGKGSQVVCEKKNEPIKILGTPQEFDDAIYRPQPNASIKVHTLQGIKVFRRIDDRGRLQTIAQVDEIEPLIRQYFLTSSRGHDRML